MASRLPGKMVIFVADTRRSSTYTAACFSFRTCMTMLCGIVVLTRRSRKLRPVISGVPGLTVSPTSTSRFVTTPP